MKLHTWAALCLLAGSFILLPLFGCHDEPAGPAQITGSGRLVTRDVPVSSFSGVALAGQGDVEVRQDTLQSVRIVADDNIIDRVLVSASDGVLTIDMVPGQYHDITVRAEVSLVSLDLLSLSGAGSIVTTSPVRTSSLSCTLSGAGSMSVNGSADDHALLISGAGSVHAFGLLAPHCSAVVSGTGTAEVYASSRLDATISGVGNVVYDGNPASVSQHVSGMGAVTARP